MRDGAVDREITRTAGTRRVLRHVGGLDGLRGVAVLLIMYGHLALVASPYTDLSLIITMPVPRLLNGVEGWNLGVDLFFVLSGFLITTLLLQEQAVSSRFSFSGFYWRRALRLLPPIMALVIVHGLYAWGTGLSLEAERSSSLAVLSYVSNWSWKWPSLQLIPDFGHLWSLAIEEQFYLVWPLVVVVISIRRSMKFVVATIGGAIVLVMLNRYRLWNADVPWISIYSRTDTRIDSLLVGALAAHLWVRGLVPLRLLRVAAWPALVAIAVMITVTEPEESLLNLGGYTLFAVATAVIVVAIVERVWVGHRVLAWTPLQAIGRVSYGLYIWHLPVFFAVNRYGTTWGAVPRVLVALSGSVAVTLASWFLLEKPIRRYRGLFPRGGRPADEPASGMEADTSPALGHEAGTTLR